MLLYAITDRNQLRGSDLDRRTALIALARTWARHNIDYIQIREKGLDPAALRDLAGEIVSAVRAESRHTRVLLNGPEQIALESGADGVHLLSSAQPIVAADARKIFASAGGEAIVSHSCHGLKEVLKTKEESQRNSQATVANTLFLYAPVFQKALSGNQPLPGLGIESLRAAAQAARPIPIFALGGVTRGNAQSCVEAGAAGIAGIRVFLTDDWQELQRSRE